MKNVLIMISLTVLSALASAQTGGGINHELVCSPPEVANTPATPSPAMGISYSMACQTRITAPHLLEGCDLYISDGSPDAELFRIPLEITKQTAGYVSLFNDFQKVKVTVSKPMISARVRLANGVTLSCVPYPGVGGISAGN